MSTGPSMATTAVAPVTSRLRIVIRLTVLRCSGPRAGTPVPAGIVERGDTMRAVGMRGTALGAIAATAAVCLAAPAGAAIRPTPDRSGEASRGATKFARAITTKRNYIRRASFSALPPFSNPAAVSTTRLAGFPLHGRAFGILASGDATDARRNNFNPDFSTSLGGPSVRGARDVTILRLDLRVPAKRNCLSIRFRFLTEEYPEYVNDIYNDAFIAELDRSSWTAADKQNPVITAPGNFAADTLGNPIRVNAVGDTSLTRARARGTTYDGATRRLRASTRVSPGAHILYLSIFDQGDREYDSAVFLDRLTLERRQTCRSGAVRD